MRPSRLEAGSAAVFVAITIAGGVYAVCRFAMPKTPVVKSEAVVEAAAGEFRSQSPSAEMLCVYPDWGQNKLSVNLATTICSERARRITSTFDSS